jgi:hypothetical protein
MLPEREIMHCGTDGLQTGCWGTGFELLVPPDRWRRHIIRVTPSERGRARRPAGKTVGTDTYVALADLSGAPDALERYFAAHEFRILPAAR